MKARIDMSYEQNKTNVARDFDVTTVIKSAEGYLYLVVKQSLSTGKSFVRVDCKVFELRNEDFTVVVKEKGTLVIES